MEPESPIDYKLVLADLEAKLAEHKAKCKCAELETAISAVKRILGYADVSIIPSVSAPPATLSGAPFIPPPPELPSWNGQTENLPDDAFFKMSTAEAAKKYLRMVKKKKSTRDIALALERGGFAHESKNFYVSLWNVLNRESQNEDSEIIKIKTLWALREWYPDRRQ